MPKGWEFRRLGDLAETRLGKTLPRGAGSTIGGQPYLRNVNVRWGRLDLRSLNTMDFSDSEMTELALLSGDILVCEGGEVGRCALMEEDLPGIFFQNALHRVRAGADVHPSFLCYALEDLVKRGGLHGITSQLTIAHLNQAKLRDLLLPVPPLQEQRRISDLIGALDESVAAASEVTLAAEQSVVELREHLFAPRSHWEETRLGDHLTRISRPVTVVANESYTEIGVRSHGRGVFVKAPTTGTEIGKKRVFFISPGQLVFNIVFAWEGAVAVLGPETDGMIASHRFPTYASPSAGGVDLLANFFRTSGGKVLLEVCSPGGAGRNRTLNQKALLSSPVKLPPAHEWSSVVDLLTAAMDHAVACAEAETALRALRSEVVSVLLSGEHPIPSTYDEVMSEAV